MAITYDTASAAIRLGASNGSTNSTTGSVDITTAATGSFVLMLFFCRGSVTVGSFTGWTSVGIRAAVSLTCDLEVYYRAKQSGDTTFTYSVNSTTVGVVMWTSYLGVDGATPIESAGSQTFTNTSYTTPSEIPISNGRWAVAFFGGEGSGTTTNTVFPTPSGLTSRIQDFDKPATSTCPAGQIADSDGVVAVTSQSFTSVPTVTGGTAGSGGAGLLFLVPAIVVPPITLNRTPEIRASLW